MEVFAYAQQGFIQLGSGSVGGDIGHFVLYAIRTPGWGGRATPLDGSGFIDGVGGICVRCVGLSAILSR
jgi:hypothetical protein